MTKKRVVAGFAMLEVVLAIVLFSMVSVGVYNLFKSGLDTQNISTSASELNTIAYVYTNLSTSGLTSDLSSADGLTTLLFDSGKLSSDYFTTTTSEGSDGKTSTTTSMINAYGDLTFSSVSAYGFKVKIPLALDSTDSDAQTLYSLIKNSYSCVNTDSDGYCEVTSGTGVNYVYFELDLTS